jgi:hypothetical protein
VTCPYTFIVEKTSNNLRLELISLQRDKRLIETLNSVKYADSIIILEGGDFWAVIPNKAISKALKKGINFFCVHSQL